MSERNPQAAQMADESMVRTLAAQTRCIWPQEQAFVARYGSPARVLDVGCGTGQFTARIAERFPQAQIHGVDVIDAHLALARRACAAHGDRVAFARGDAYALDLPDGSMDLVCCRHVLQSVPEPERIIAECIRVLKPGGWLHLILEDYTMIHFEGVDPKLDQFWLDGPVAFGRKTGCDMRIGRRGPALLRGLTQVRQDYVTVDTERCDRDDFAAIWIAWRDGYTDVLAEHSGWSRPDIWAAWNTMIRIIETGYAVWQVPVVSGQKPH